MRARRDGQTSGGNVRGRLVAPVLCAALFAATPPARAEVILYSQVVEPSNQNIGFGFYSSSVPRARRNFKHADDFTLAEAGTVGSVRWWGINEGVFSTGLANYDTWTVEFYTSQPSPGNALVGTLIHSETFAKADTSPTPTGRVNPLNAEAETMQRATLASPVALEAGAQYWIAISAHPLSGSGDAWNWRDGLTLNGYSNLYSYATGLWTGFQDTDSAFELIAVPSPATGATLPIGMAAWFHRHRRR